MYICSYGSKQMTFFAPTGSKNVLCLTVLVRIVVSGSGGSVQTVGIRRFTGMISSFLFRLSESESEPESACTVRVPLGDRLAVRCLRLGTSYPAGLISSAVAAVTNCQEQASDRGGSIACSVTYKAADEFP